ncbi:delta endotoxin C-terminal domain-containing protein, partial [Bacillus cereus]
TGGDLVKLNPGSQLDLMVSPDSYARYKPFKVRIRYASESNGNLNVAKWNQEGTAFWENKDIPVEQSFGESMTYQSFKYVETISVPANEDTFRIVLHSKSGGPMYIDKIELIPLNSSLAEYEA